MMMMIIIITDKSAFLNDRLLKYYELSLIATHLSYVKL
jgi:hypothetical protein